MTKKENVLKFMQYIEKLAKVYEFNIPYRSYDIYAFAKDLLDWLERQGKETSEKEFTFKALPRLLEMMEVSDRAKAYTEKLAVALDNEGYHTDAKIVRESIKIMNGEEVPMATMDEQKPADTVESKFKVGDWITNGDYTWKIVEVKPLDYILQSQDGNIVDDTISHVDEQFHSFTIEDAKDGDTLINKNYMRESPFIFKETKPSNIKTDVPNPYCALPYLRPMSSMTETEVLEYISLKESIVASDGITYAFETYKSIDWLNAHHFDYRNLIEKGLAIEAPEGRYN